MEKNIKSVPWSENTIEKGLQLRFACGTSGYELLLRMGLPFPSVRSLQNRVEHITLKPGLFDSVFDLMASKVKEMNAQEKLCVLSFDEMSLQPKYEYDVQHGSFDGECTLARSQRKVQGSDNPLATKALVFNLGGLTTRWKKVVGFHFTANSFSWSCLKDLIVEIVSQCSRIGLHVAAVVCDMGPCNQAMWRSFGISCSRGKICNKIPHPSDSTDSSVHF